MTTHTREALAAQAAENGMAVIVTLAKGDKSWNPERNDTLLRGPAVVTYIFWDVDDIDFAFRPLTV